MNIYDDLKILNKRLINQSNDSKLLLELGELYYKFCSASTCFTLNIDDTSGTIITDWQSHHNAIYYLEKSFTIKPSLQAALLILNLYNTVFKYEKMIEFINKNRLIDLFPNERYTILNVYFHSLLKKGLIKQSLLELQNFSSYYFDKAQEVFEIEFENKDEPEEIFKRLANANLIAVFSEGMIENDFIKSLSILFSYYNSEISIQDHYSINMEWEYESCKQLAKQLHNEGLMKFAAQFYATAFTLNPMDHKLELSFAVALHRMGEHSSTFKLLKKYLEVHPTETLAYIIACTSCTVDLDIPGLISTLKQAQQNNVDDSPIFDLFKGFYLERKGDLQRAKNFYQKKLWDLGDDPIYPFFESHIKRIESIS